MFLLDELYVLKRFFLHGGAVNAMKKHRFDGEGRIKFKKRLSLLSSMMALNCASVFWQVLCNECNIFSPLI